MRNRRTGMGTWLVTTQLNQQSKSNRLQHAVQVGVQNYEFPGLGDQNYGLPGLGDQNYTSSLV